MTDTKPEPMCIEERNAALKTALRRIRRECEKSDARTPFQEALIRSIDEIASKALERTSLV